MVRALDLAAATLSAGRASRLYRALREPGIVGSVSAFNYSPTEVGVFGVAIGPGTGAGARGARRGAAAEIVRLREQGPDPDALERARTLLRVRWARRFETADGRAMELAAAHAIGGVRLLDEEYAALLATCDRGAGPRRGVPDLDPGNVAAVAYLPCERGGDLSVELVRKRSGRADGRRADGRAVGRTVGRSADRPTIRPSARLPVRPSIAEVHHGPLPGADILARRHRGAPLVTIGLYRRRLAFDPQARAGLAALAVRSAVRGAGDLDATGLALAFERLGGSLAPAGHVGVVWLPGHGAAPSISRRAAGELLELVLRFPEARDGQHHDRARAARRRRRAGRR